MAYMLVRIRLHDFDQWKSVWEEPQEIEIRRAYGCTEERIFRGTDSPSEAVILMKWGDLEEAKEFGISSELRQAMNRSGGADTPDVLFMEELG